MINLNKENIEVLSYMAVTNPASYNYNKALEECVEFQEVLIKVQTKHPKNPKRPNPQDAIGEYGDTMYRGLVALMNLFPNKSIEQILEEVSKHVDKKLGNLRKYKKEGNYLGGL